MSGCGRFGIDIPVRRSCTPPLVTVAGFDSIDELVDVRLLFKTLELLLLLLVWVYSSLWLEFLRF